MRALKIGRFYRIQNFFFFFFFENIKSFDCNGSLCFKAFQYSAAVADRALSNELMTEIQKHSLGAVP